MKLFVRTLMASSLLVGISFADNLSALSTMDFVSIGELGNAADTTSYGAVAYDYGIGTREVTGDQFLQSGLGGAAGATPVINVNWFAAARFANWLTSGNTNNGAYTISGGGVSVDRAAAVFSYGTVYVLPTLDEFYKAAYFDATGGGAGYSKYSDGSSVQPVAGTDVNYNSALASAWSVGSGFIEQNGTKDMMGNVWEWLETSADPSTRKVSGGAWNSDNQSLKNVGSRPDVLLDHSTDSLGLRIVVIPEPGTISLMSLSTMGLFFTRTLRRRKLAGRSVLPIRHAHFCDAYCSMDEWKSSFEKEKTLDLFDAVMQLFIPSLKSAWSKVHVCYQAMDRAFWNRMVVSYESRLVTRKNFRIALKKNTLACFDGFLSLFMK